MNRYCAILFAICFGMQAFATQYCPKPQEIFPYNYLGFTVYRAPNYLSRWVYENDLKIDKFIHVEADAHEVMDCWYVARKPHDPKPYILTLSPLDDITPKVNNGSWIERDSNFYTCDADSPELCPLD